MITTFSLPLIASYKFISMSSKTRASLPVGSSLIDNDKDQAKLTRGLRRVWLFKDAEKVSWELIFPLSYWPLSFISWNKRTLPVRLYQSDFSCTLWLHISLFWCFALSAPQRRYLHPFCWSVCILYRLRISNFWFLLCMMYIS